MYGNEPLYIGFEIPQVEWPILRSTHKAEVDRAPAVPRGFEVLAVGRQNKKIPYDRRRGIIHKGDFVIEQEGAAFKISGPLFGP
jgi:hypothetical protein